MMEQEQPQISVNDVIIGEVEIASEIQHHPAESSAQAWGQAAHALVVRELLLQKGRKLGLEAEPQSDDEGRMEMPEDAIIRQLLDKEVAIPDADDETCERYYEQNKSQFRSPEIFEPAHILISADRNDAGSYEKASDKTAEIIERLIERPDLFSDFAKEYSDCSSSSQGGVLGQTVRGQTTPEFETFLLTLEEGQLCRVPVKTRYGVHILRLDRRIEGKTLPFELVKERIAEFLLECSWRRGVSQYIRILGAEAEISGINLDAAETPLVQ